MKWHSIGWRSYENETGDAQILYFQNAGMWRADDWRGLPAADGDRGKPLSESMSFHRTLAEAKRWVAGSTWHLDGVARSQP